MNPIFLSLTHQQNFFFELHKRSDEAPYFDWVEKGDMAAPIETVCFLKNNHYSFTDGFGRKGLLLIQDELSTVLFETDPPEGTPAIRSKRLIGYANEAFTFMHREMKLSENLYCLKRDDPLTIGSPLHQVLSVYLKPEEFPYPLQDSMRRYLHSKNA